MQGDYQATAYGVVVDNSSGAPKIVDKFDVTNDEADLATRLYDMAENVRTKVDSLAPDAVVIRRADFPPTGSRKEAPKVRLLAEGALASASRHKCVDTYLGSGRDFGTWTGTGKDAVEIEAKSLLKDAGLALKYLHAACAGIAAFSHP